MKYEEASMEILWLPQEDVVRTSDNSLTNIEKEDPSDQGDFGNW